MLAQLDNARREAERERNVRGMLHFVDELGTAAERFFSRLYRGLGRKSATPPRPDPDQISALRQANRELTARMREMQTVAARMEAVFARLNEGVIMQSPEGRVVMMNPAATTLIGSMRAFWESELGRLFRRAQNTPRGDGELTPLGEPIRVQLNDRILGAQIAAVQRENGDPLGTLIVLRDVTREALVERIKDQFVTQITHELRTPLTSIKGMSDVLLNTPPDRPVNRKFLEAIARNAAVLDRMIVELLDLSEISAGTLSMRQRTVTLDLLAQDALNARAAQIKKAGLSTGVMAANPHLLTLDADDQRLLWALGHVIDNAINYTLSGGAITVRVGRVRGDYVLIEVIDTGVGITEYDQAHVFERFYRGQAVTPDGRTLDPRGLGQGLYIARAVAEAHGGFLTVSSAVGQGSKFTMGLPRALVAVQALQNP